jgi:hypothetical protein
VVHDPLLSQPRLYSADFPVSQMRTVHNGVRQLPASGAGLYRPPMLSASSAGAASVVGGGGGSPGAFSSGGGGVMMTGHGTTAVSGQSMPHGYVMGMGGSAVNGPTGMYGGGGGGAGRMGVGGGVRSLGAVHARGTGQSMGVVESSGLYVPPMQAMGVSGGPQTMMPGGFSGGPFNGQLMLGPDPYGAGMHPVHMSGGAMMSPNMGQSGFSTPGMAMPKNIYGQPSHHMQVHPQQQQQQQQQQQHTGYPVQHQQSLAAGRVMPGFYNLPHDGTNVAGGSRLGMGMGAVGGGSGWGRGGYGSSSSVLGAHEAPDGGAGMMDNGWTMHGHASLAGPGGAFRAGPSWRMP